MGILQIHFSGGEPTARRISVDTATGRVEPIEVVLAGPEEPASFQLSAVVHGPTGPGGRVTLDGWSALSPDASGAPPGSVSLTLEELLLEALEPALAVALELEDPTLFAEANEYAIEEIFDTPTAGSEARIQ